MEGKLGQRLACMSDKSLLPEGPQTSQLQASVSSGERKLLETFRGLSQVVQGPQPAGTSEQVPCGWYFRSVPRRQLHATPDGVSDWEPTDISPSVGSMSWIPHCLWKLSISRLQTPAQSAGPCQPAARLFQPRT